MRPNDGLGAFHQRHAVRFAVLGVGRGNGPPAGDQIHVGPLHPHELAATLARKQPHLQQGREGRAHRTQRIVLRPLRRLAAGRGPLFGGGEVFQHPPEPADLVIGQHTFPRDFPRGFGDARRRVGLDPVVVYGEVEHFSHEREDAIREDGRPAIDYAVNDGAHVAPRQVAHGSIAPRRQHIHGQEAFIFVGRAFESPCVPFQVVLGQRLDGIRRCRLRRLPLAGRVFAVVDRALRVARALTGCGETDRGIFAEFQAPPLAVDAVANAELDSSARQDAHQQAALLGVPRLSGRRPGAERPKMPVCQGRSRGNGRHSVAWVTLHLLVHYGSTRRATARNSLRIPDSRNIQLNHGVPGGLVVQTVSGAFRKFCRFLTVAQEVAGSIPVAHPN